MTELDTPAWAGQQKCKTQHTHAALATIYCPSLYRANFYDAHSLHHFDRRIRLPHFQFSTLRLQTTRAERNFPSLAQEPRRLFNSSNSIESGCRGPLFHVGFTMLDVAHDVTILYRPTRFTPSRRHRIDYDKLMSTMIIDAADALTHAAYMTLISLVTLMPFGRSGGISQHKSLKVS